MKLNGLDEKDNLIVNLLLKNARMSYSDIGDAVGLTRVAAKNRVKTLEEKGVIKGYHAAVDPLAVPEMQTYIAFIQTEPGAYDDISAKLRDEKPVVILCQTSGDSCLHAVCVAETIHEMREFAKRIRTENPGLLRFAAYAVLDIIKGDLFPNMEKEHANEDHLIR